MSRSRQKRNLLLIFGSILLVLVSYYFRKLPWGGISPLWSHFFVGHYSAIQLTLELNHIPNSQTYPGIANFKVSLLDQWFRLVYFSTILDVLGIQAQQARLRFLHLFNIQPLLLALGSVLLVGNDKSVRTRFVAFVFPLFAGQIAIARSAHALYDWGFGAAFFMWAFVGLILGIRKKNFSWFVLTPIFGVLVFASRHTAGLILIFALLFVVAGSLLFQVDYSHRILSISLLSIVIFVLVDVLIFDYLGNVLTWGIVETGRVLLGATFGADVQTLSIGGTKGYELTVSKILSVLDRILITALLSISVLVWLGSTPYLRQFSPESIQTTNGQEYSVLSISVLMLFSITLASITFYFFKGIPGMLGRGQQYMTLFGLIVIPCLLSVIQEEVSNESLRNITIMFMILLMVVSPVAYVTSENTTNGSPWLTHGEEQSLKTVQNHVPTDSRVAGSYHIVPPLVYSHPCLVGPHWREDPKNYSTELKGLYYQVNTHSMRRAIDSLESRYGDINMLLVSERVSTDLGVHTKAKHPGLAPDSIWSDYRSVPYLDHVYSGRVHTYTTGKDTSCGTSFVN